MAITLNGTLERWLDDDEFILSDDTGSIGVYIGPHEVPATVGERLTVNGQVDDDLPLEVYADTLQRADGSTFTVGGPYN